MHEYQVRDPYDSFIGYFDARSDKMAIKKAQDMVKDCGLLEYTWQDDSTNRVLILDKVLTEEEAEEAGTTHEHVCDVKEFIGMGNLTEYVGKEVVA